MYRTPNPKQLAFENLALPFGGKLRSDNRWGMLAKQIPWQEVEQEYARQFSDEDLGSPPGQVIADGAWRADLERAAGSH